MSFELRKEVAGKTLVIVVEGEFVLGPKLRHSSANVKNLGDVTGIVVDLAGCSRVDSAGLGELLMWYGIATRAQQRILLAGVREPVKAMMRVARVDGILLSAVDRAAAMAELT
jgi:anti-anti-sigma regulatory factor